MSRSSADAVKGWGHDAPTACAPENSSERQKDGTKELHASQRQNIASPESRRDNAYNFSAACKDDTAHRVQVPLRLDRGNAYDAKPPENLLPASEKTWTDVNHQAQNTGVTKDSARDRAMKPPNLSAADTNDVNNGRMLSQTSDDDSNYGKNHRELQPRSLREGIPASRRQVPFNTELVEISRQGGEGDTEGAKHGGILPQTPDEDAKDTNKQRATVRAPHKLDESQCRSLGPATKDRGKTCSAVRQKSFAAEDESKSNSGDDLMQLKRIFGVPVTQLLPVNCDLKPSKTFDEYWLFEMNFLNYRMNSDYPDSEDGKWMTFHPVEELDEAWAWAKHLYRSGQLPEIKCMNVATAAFNPDYADKDQSIKVICFFCGPVSNKPKMLRIGRQVAQLMNYQAKHIAYRTVNQYRQKIPGCIYKIYKW